jgi:steroid delta-isomerase-like uncharacterized protein
MSTRISTQEIVERGVHAFNLHDAESFAALYTTGCIVYDPQYLDPLKGREAVRKDVEAFFDAFPDVQIKVVSVLGNGDTIAFEVEMSGTHRGPIVSPAGVLPATNKRMTMRVGSFNSVDGQGLITDSRRYFDMAGLLEQLGLNSQ